MRLLMIVSITACAVLAATLVLVSNPDSGETAFPGTNGRIIYTSAVALDVDIWTMNPDGSDPQKLTTSGDNNDPAASADGMRIAFKSNRDGNPEIYVMNSNGSSQKRLTNDPAADDDVSWSPDGTRLIWGSTRIPEGTWVMNVDGSNPEFLVDGEDAAWSPDGAKIVYVVEDPDSQIWVMNANGGGHTQLTNDVGGTNEDPQWSPDRTKILFVKEETGDAIVMDANGSDPTNLTNDAFDVADPVWSPDGTKIAFRDNGDIFVMNSDGTNPENITPGGGNESNLDWLPIPPTPTQSPSPTPSPMPTATPPPGPQLAQGDNDCDGDSDSVDALKGLQHVAAIDFSQEPDCPTLGGALPAALPAGDPPDLFGDVDCDDDVDSVDGLKILQSVAAIPFSQNEPCTDVGEPL